MQCAPDMESIPTRVRTVHSCMCVCSHACTVYENGQDDIQSIDVHPAVQITVCSSVRACTYVLYVCMYACQRVQVPRVREKVGII